MSDLTIFLFGIVISLLCLSFFFITITELRKAARQAEAKRFGQSE